MAKGRTSTKVETLQEPVQEVVTETPSEQVEVNTEKTPEVEEEAAPSVPEVKEEDKKSSTQTSAFQVVQLSDYKYELRRNVPGGYKVLGRGTREKIEYLKSQYS